MIIEVTRRKIALAVIGLAVLVATTAGSCSSSNSNANSVTDGSKAQYSSQELSVQGYTNMTAQNKYPAKKLNTSTELDNLNERLQRYNDPNKISYVYLISNTGTVIGYYTIKGKVSSNSSQMTATQDVIDGCPQSSGQDEAGVCPIVVDAPGDDGSFGPSEPGIFFFTTDNVMITWDGQYLESDAPMKIDVTALTVQYVAGSKPTSTAGIIK